MAKILIVDDSPTETLRFKSILESLGYDVIAATNGADGVLMAKEHLPDVILMDVVMPGMNGFQATRELTKAQETQHIPVIIVSTKDQETDKVWGKRQGAKDYLVKPINQEKLVALLSQYLTV